MKKNRIFKPQRIQLLQMYEDAIAFLQKSYGQVGRYFSAASPLGHLLRVVLEMGQLIFFYIEDTITELNIKKATRPHNIRGLAALVGHNSTRAISATGSLQLTYNGEDIDIYGNSVIIPNYTQIKNKANSLKYLLMMDSEESRINLIENNSIILKVIQGEIQTQTFTSNGEALQSFNVPVRGAKNIENFFVNVYINGEKWQKYESLWDMPRNSKGFLVRNSVASGIDVFFGNEHFGAIPGMGSEITVEFLLTQGMAGNINVEESIQNWEFLDSGYDIEGNEVDLNEIIKVTIHEEITFGAAAEPLYLTKIVAPRQSRSFVLANPDAYIVFLEKLNYFSIIDAFLNLDDEGYIKDDNVIYLFLIPDISKKLAARENYFNTDIDNFYLTESQKEKIYNLINDSGQVMIGTEHQILNPIIKRYVLNISLIVYEGYSTNFIKEQIIDRLSNYFINNRRRDRIPKSDLIHIIEEIAGIDSVNLWFLSEANELAKKGDPNAPVEGLDKFGDIVLGRGELALIRGDWTDSRGVYYNDKVSTEEPSSVNIQIYKSIPKTYNLEQHRINLNKNDDE